MDRLPIILVNGGQSTTSLRTKIKKIFIGVYFCLSVKQATRRDFFGYQSHLHIIVANNVAVLHTCIRNTNIKVLMLIGYKNSKTVGLILTRNIGGLATVSLGCN